MNPRTHSYHLKFLNSFLTENRTDLDSCELGHNLPQRTSVNSILFPVCLLFFIIHVYSIRLYLNESNWEWTYRCTFSAIVFILNLKGICDYKSIVWLSHRQFDLHTRCSSFFTLAFFTLAYIFISDLHLFNLLPRPFAWLEFLKYWVHCVNILSKGKL